MSVSHEHFNFWFVEIGADFDKLLKLLRSGSRNFTNQSTAKIAGKTEAAS